jgi:hypothetical protein
MAPAKMERGRETAAAAATSSKEVSTALHSHSVIPPFAIVFHRLERKHRRPVTLTISLAVDVDVYACIVPHGAPLLSCCLRLKVRMLSCTMIAVVDRNKLGMPPCGLDTTISVYTGVHAAALTACADARDLFICHKASDFRSGSAALNSN